MERCLRSDPRSPLVTGEALLRVADKPAKWMPGHWRV